MIKKIKMWAWVLAFVLLSQQPVSRAIQGVPTAQLTPASQSIQIGQTTSVDLAVQSIQNLYGYQVTIRFDPAVIEVVDADTGKPGIQVALGSFLSPDFVHQNSADNDQGMITCVVAQVSPHLAVSGNGTLFTITVRGKAQGASDIHFVDLKLARPDGTEIPVVQENAQVTVEGVPPPTPRLTIASPAVDIGHTTAVQVWVNDVKDFYGLGFELSFDSAIVRALAIEAGPAFTAHPGQYQIVRNQVGPGTARFTASFLQPISPPLDGNLHLATVTFEGTGCGKTTLDWQDTSLLDSHATPISHTTQGGSIQVSCPNVAVTGRALLQGCGSSDPAVQMTNGTITVTTVAENGWYTFTNVSGGTYDLILARRLYLTARLESCQIGTSGTTRLPDVTLPGGDLDGNQVIDISDLTMAASCFNISTSACQDKADITNDGIVDIFDVVLIGINHARGSFVVSCTF